MSEGTAIIRFAGNTIKKCILLFSQHVGAWSVYRKKMFPQRPQHQFMVPMVPTCSLLLFLSPIFPFYLTGTCLELGVFFQYTPPWMGFLTPASRGGHFKDKRWLVGDQDIGAELIGGHPACRWTHGVPGGTPCHGFSVSLQIWPIKSTDFTDSGAEAVDLCPFADTIKAMSLHQTLKIPNFSCYPSVTISAVFSSALLVARVTVGAH